MIWPLDLATTVVVLLMVAFLPTSLLVARLVRDARKQAKALRRSEAYLAEAQRLSRTGSFGWSVSSGEILWSEETYRIFQYDRTTKPTVERILQRVHPEDAARVETDHRARFEWAGFRFRASIADAGWLDQASARRSSRHERRIGRHRVRRCGDGHHGGKACGSKGSAKAKGAAAHRHRDDPDWAASVSRPCLDGSVDLVSRRLLRIIGLAPRRRAGLGLDARNASIPMIPLHGDGRLAGRPGGRTTDSEVDLRIVLRQADREISAIATAPRRPLSSTPRATSPSGSDGDRTRTEANGRETAAQRDQAAEDPELLSGDGREKRRGHPADAPRQDHPLRQPIGGTGARLHAAGVRRAGADGPQSIRTIRCIRSPAGRSCCRSRTASRSTRALARHKDGSWRWIESTTRNLLHEPGVQAVVVNFRDITERKLAEAERERLGAAAAPGREDGSDRAARRRHRARLQQRPGRHLRLRRNALRRSARGLAAQALCAERAHRRDPWPRARRADPRLQPQPARQARAGRRRRTSWPRRSSWFEARSPPTSVSTRAPPSRRSS